MAELQIRDHELNRERTSLAAAQSEIERRAAVLVEAEQRGEQLVALGFVGAMRSAVAPGVLGPLGTGRAGPGIPSISRSIG